MVESNRGREIVKDDVIGFIDGVDVRRGWDCVLVAGEGGRKAEGMGVAIERTAHKLSRRLLGALSGLRVSVLWEHRSGC